MSVRECLRAVAGLGLTTLVVAACGDATEPTGPAVAAAARVEGVASMGRPVVTVNPHAGPGAPSTIQEGIDLVAPGGRVRVLGGVYAELLTIDKGVTVEALPNQEVIVRPGLGDGVDVVTVTTSAPVVLRGLTLDCDCHWVDFTGAGVYGQGQVDITLEGMAVLNAGLGAWVLWSGEPRATLTIRDSYFDGGPDRVMAVAVWAVRSTYALVENSTVRGTYHACLQAQAWASADFVGNGLEDCGINGGVRITTFDASSVINVIGNTIQATPDGINRWGIIKTDFGDDELGAPAVRIEHNRILGFQGMGASPAAVEGIRLIAGGAYDVPPVVRFNDLEGTPGGPAGLYYEVTHPDAPATIDATCNWWGAADGPSGDGPGSGSGLGGPATVSPWATGPIAGTGATGC